jgi:hypothetical protein
MKRQEYRVSLPREQYEKLEQAAIRSSVATGKLQPIHTFLAALIDVYLKEDPPESKKPAKKQAVRKTS